MSPFFKSKVSMAVILNISGEGVHGALMKECGFKNKRVVIYKTKKTGFGGSLRSIDDFESILKDVILEISKKFDLYSEKEDKKENCEIDKVVCITDHPFEYTYLDDVFYTNEEKLKVDDEFFKEILRRDEFGKVPSSRTLVGDESTVYVFLKREMLDLKLNGYSVKKSKDKFAKEIEFSLYNVVMSENVQSILKTEIKKRFRNINHIDILVRSDVEITFLNQFHKKSGSYRYVHVGFLETLLITLQDGAIRGVSHINVGYDDIFKKLAERLNVPDVVARSYVKTCFSDEAEESFSGKVKEIVSDVLNKWKGSYEDFVSGAVESIYLNCDNVSVEDNLKLFLIDKHPESEIKTLREVFVEKMENLSDNKSTSFMIDLFLEN